MISWVEYNRLAKELWQSGEPERNLKIMAMLYRTDALCSLAKDNLLLIVHAQDLAMMWLAAYRCIQEMEDDRFCTAWITELRIPSLDKCAVYVDRAVMEKVYGRVETMPYLPIALSLSHLPGNLRYDPVLGLDLNPVHLVLIAREDGTYLLGEWLPGGPIHIPILDLPRFRRMDLDTIAELDKEYQQFS